MVLVTRLEHLSTVGTTDQLIQQNWHHFVLIKNQNNYKIYLNKDEIYSEDLNNSFSPVSAIKNVYRDVSLESFLW